MNGIVRTDGRMTSAIDSTVTRRRPGRDTLDLLKRDPFVLSMFFCLLFLGGDRIALTAGGLTFRMVFPLLMSAFFFLYARQGGTIAFDRTLSFLFILLSIAGAVSSLNSLAPGKSVGYAIWVLFDFFVIISLCYNLARLYEPDTVLDLWLWVFRIHGLLSLASVALSVILNSAERPRLWFYETSYLAIFMTGYFGSALYLLLKEGRRYRWDFLLSLVVMGALTSATALMGVIFCVLMNLVIARQRLKILVVTVLLGAAFFGTLYLLFRNTLYYTLVAGFLLNPNVSFDLVLQRAGNRWVRLLIGWDAFQQHPWLGVGIGGDTAYMAASAFPEQARALTRPWFEMEEGQPFCNIVVEVLGTMGIAGFVPFFAILSYALFRMIQLARSGHASVVSGMAFFMGFLSSFAALQLEGTFLRYYLWAPLGLGLGVLARMDNSARSKPCDASLFGAKPL